MNLENQMEIDDQIFYFSSYPPVQDPEKLMNHLIEQMKMVERMNIIIGELKQNRKSGYLVNHVFEVERLLKMQGFSSKEIEYLFNYVQEVCVDKGYMINEEFTDIMMSILGERVAERKRLIDRAYGKYEKPTIRWTDKKTGYSEQCKSDIVAISME